jgi:hypothetical protein
MLILFGICHNFDHPARAGASRRSAAKASEAPRMLAKRGERWRSAATIPAARF